MAMQYVQFLGFLDRRLDNIYNYYWTLLFIENNSKVLMKWSYPFGSSPNFELWHHHRILKTHTRHYDVICSYIENTYMTL